MQNVFIIGSKGIPAAYGGYETFVDKLTEYHTNEEQISYHVACKNAEQKEFQYNGARCFNVPVPKIGPAAAVVYDLKALSMCIDYIKENHSENPLIYILACRIGPFMKGFKKKCEKLGIGLYVNPDGHEWLRAKWSAPIRKYWKISEKLMVKHADLLVCDSKNIEKYILEEYKNYHPATTYIAYGTEPRKSLLTDDDEKFSEWLKEHNLKQKEYYLVVGRFVPENNYETMIREFMKSRSDKVFALITEVNDKFLNELEQKTKFRSDSRIRFVGTVYDKELLMKIRENAFAYFHGHEVGGTNPSLLEALGSTDLNLLLDVGFNREVALDAALYWSKEEGSLSSLIDTCEKQDNSALSVKAKERIKDAFSWQFIVDQYKELFLGK